MAEEQNKVVSIQDRKRAQVDFENVWREARIEGFPSFKDSYEFVYMQGRAAGYAAAKREKQEKNKVG